MEKNLPIFSRIPSRLLVAWLSAKLCFKTLLIRACVYYRQYVWKKKKAHRLFAAVSNVRGDTWKEPKISPITIFDGGFMEKYAIESLRIFRRPAGQRR